MSYKGIHQPCPDCGSSDALSINTNDTTFSHSCRKYTRSSDTRELLEDIVEEIVEVEKRIVHAEMDPSMLSAGQSMALVERGITKETCEAYGVTVKNGAHFYPYHNEDGELVAHKVRTKDGSGKKKFRTLGKWKNITLFGENNFNGKGRYITLCEGELDALAAYQMFDSRWPVVSIATGAASVQNDIENSFEFLMNYDKIVICFDSDKEGKKAAKKAAELLSTKARIMHLKLKDANDYLINNKQEEFLQAWYQSEDYAPEGVIAGTELWDIIKEPDAAATVDYPYKGINLLTYGIRMGELITVTGGTGMGKSSFLREITKHIFDNTEDSIGLLFMEENPKRTGKGMMSLDLSTPLHLPGAKFSESDIEFEESYKRTVGSGRYYFFDHFGSNTVEEILARIRYFVKVNKCKYIILDHISIIVSSQQHATDERKTLDECMTKLRMLVQELDFCLFLVSHLSRPSEQKGSHEEGLNMSLRHLRGSQSIAQLSDIVLGLERDGQADDVRERDTTRVRVMKNRFSGLTGLCASLLYDRVTGRIVEKELDLQPEKDDDDCL